MNIQKISKNFLKMNSNINILNNKFILYFIFFISFGNFIIEMMNNDMYFVSVYILIGFLTSFFNKNMIIILSLSAIFANILKYGRASAIEGFEDGEEEVEEEENNQNPIAKELADKKPDGNVIDKIVGPTKDQNKKKKKYSKKDVSNNESDDEYDSDDENDKQKKKTYDDYKTSEKLLDNQKLLLQNMKEYKPLLDTIQNLTNTIPGLSKPPQQE
jgi:hypothetical protein